MSAGAQMITQEAVGDSAHLVQGRVEKRQLRGDAEVVK